MILAAKEVSLSSSYEHNNVMPHVQHCHACFWLTWQLAFLTKQPESKQNDPGLEYEKVVAQRMVSTMQEKTHLKLQEKIQDCQNSTVDCNAGTEFSCM